MPSNNKKTYWPHMILGFLVIGITLGYWTIKSASSMPVQESNKYMMKYQMADTGINDILSSKQAFDRVYTVELQDVQTMVMIDNVNSKRPQPNPVKLSKGNNSFSYLVTKKDGTVVDDAKVSFLLTQPHSRKNDNFLEKVIFYKGRYTTEDINITAAGRYTLLLRVIMPEGTGYSEVSAYLKP